MEEDFNQWLVADLKNLLLQYDILPTKGSGKNGNVIKADLLRAAKKIKKDRYNQINTYDAINPNLPEDIMMEILLNADIKTIEQYCYTKKYQKICNDVNFWKSLFDRDDLPLYEEPMTTEEWINMYYKMDSIVNEVNLLLKLINKEGLNDFEIRTIEKDKYHVLDISIIADRLFVYYLEDNKVRLVNQNSEMTVSLTDYENLLIKLFYFYPDLYMTGGKDQEGFHIALRRKDLSKYSYELRNTNPYTGRFSKNNPINNYLTFYENNEI